MKQVAPPVTLEDDQFVVIYDRLAESFTLALRSGATYDLGNNEEAMRYLKRSIPCGPDKFWIEEIIDRAYSFHAVQVLVADRHLVQVDFKPQRKGDSELIFSQPKDTAMSAMIGSTR